MVDNLRSLVTSYATFWEEELDQIISHFKPKTIKRNTPLLREGEVCKEFYYIVSGCIRTYFIDREGYEKTRMILLDGDLGTAYTSFITQQPSVEFVETLEDTNLLAISHKDFYKLNAEIPGWKEVYRQILEMAYLYQSRKVEALMTLNAKQRYQRLLKAKPALIQRLSNKVLASFLDMREETLSRNKSQ